MKLSPRRSNSANTSSVAPWVSGLLGDRKLGIEDRFEGLDRPVDSGVVAPEHAFQRPRHTMRNYCCPKLLKTFVGQLAGRNRHPGRDLGCAPSRSRLPGVGARNDSMASTARPTAASPRLRKRQPTPPGTHPR